MKKQSEKELQKACFSWFHLEYKKYYYNIFHIPNGGKRDIVTASILKKEGVLAGVWDVFLTIPKQGYNGFFIEMKIKPNKLTENQLNFKRHNDNFFKFAVCYSIDDFIKEINTYLINDK